VGDLGESKLGGEFGVVPGIDDPDDQLVATVPAKGPGNVELEGQVSSLVLPYLRSVEPNGGSVVHRPEMEDVAGGTPVRRFWELKGSTIPGHPTVVSQIVELGLPWSWHLDGPSVLRPEALLRQLPCRVGIKLPLTIQAGTLTAHDTLLQTPRIIPGV
jgi:hypothetical protein